MVPQVSDNPEWRSFAAVPEKYLPHRRDPVSDCEPNWGRAFLSGADTRFQAKHTPDSVMENCP